MKNIWLDDEYYQLPSLTDQAVENAEEKLKVKLPATYINLLKEQNGGSLVYNAFPSPVPTSWAVDHINIDHILGISEEEGILQSDYLIREWGLPENLVLFSGNGHSWIAFDFRNTKEDPPIIFIDTESEQLLELAPNFNAFLAGLYVQEDKDEAEDAYVEPQIKDWTLAKIDIAISTNNKMQVIQALDYLHQNKRGNEHFIEQKLMVLLQSPLLDLKEIAANHAYEFNKRRILSSEGLQEIIHIIQKDPEIDYYVDMFFPNHSGK